MSDDSFSSLEETLGESGLEAGFDKLAALLRAEKKYPQLFEALLMKKRHEFGLPLEGTDSINDLPEEVQVDVENYYIEVCRIVGGLFLDDGNIPGAWPYFRAIEEPDKVARALDEWQPEEDSDDDEQLSLLDEIVDIALNQGANPRRGYDLVLSQYGVCRSITIFEHQFPYKGKVKSECGRMLVNRLYNDLVENVRADVEAHLEQNDPEARSRIPPDADLRTLIQDRDWLFEGMGYHVDVSHLMAVVRVAGTLEDQESIDKGVQMAEYGRRLGRDFQHPDSPPFEDFYNDYRIFLRALKGEGVDGAVRYFTQAAERHSVDEEGRHFPGEVLVYLLHRAGRTEEAIDAHLKYMKQMGSNTTIAPSLAELCEATGDYSKMLEVAREEDNLLQFMTGLVKGRGVVTDD